MTLSLFSGSDYVSYFDVPANIFSTDVTDLSSVNLGGTQAQTNEILDAKIPDVPTPNEDGSIVVKNIDDSYDVADGSTVGQITLG